MLFPAIQEMSRGTDDNACQCDRPAESRVSMSEKSRCRKAARSAFSHPRPHAGYLDISKLHGFSANFAPLQSINGQSVRQVEQDTVRVRKTLFAQLAAFQILPVSFAFAADADFARR